jgi:hypothetical protein
MSTRTTHFPLPVTTVSALVLCAAMILPAPQCGIGVSMPALMKRVMLRTISTSVWHPSAVLSLGPVFVAPNNRAHDPIRVHCISNINTKHRAQRRCAKGMPHQLQGGHAIIIYCVYIGTCINEFLDDR